jgi:hypothetical protein
VSSLVKSALAVTALTALGACASVAPGWAPAAGTRAPSSIAISVGPCFGFCPVYDVKIAADGAVSFTGTRHTAVLGTRERQAKPQAYRAIASDLAPFRPAGGGMAAIQCAVEVSDMPTYTITWIDSAGQKAVATHRGGCREGKGQSLDAVLRELPQRLGIGEWMKQTTRPGVSRG